MLLYLLILGANVEPYHPSRPTCGLVKTRKHVHSSGLSGSVSTEKAEYFTLLYRERDVVYSMKTAESFDQMFHFDDVFSLFFRVISLLMLYRRWIKDILEGVKNSVGSTYSPQDTI